MNRSPIDVNALTIASPCTVPWDSMAGNERRRFCGQCRLHVHDVSRMTRRETEELIESAEGRCCLRLWRRADGRVITKDCGRVRLALARRLTAMRAVAAGLFAALGLTGCASKVAHSTYQTTGVLVAPTSPRPPDPATTGTPIIPATSGQTAPSK